MNKAGHPSLLSRILVDVGVGLGIIGFAVVYAFASIYTGKQVSVGWLGLLGFTPVVFWKVTRSTKRHWHRAGFWAAVGGLLVLHLLAFVAVLLYYPKFPLLWFVPLSIVEIGLFVAILGKLFDGSKASRI